MNTGTINSGQINGGAVEETTGTAPPPPYVDLGPFLCVVRSELSVVSRMDTCRTTVARFEPLRTLARLDTLRFVVLRLPPPPPRVVSRILPPPRFVARLHTELGARLGLGIELCAVHRVLSHTAVFRLDLPSDVVVRLEPLPAAVSRLS